MNTTVTDTKENTKYRMKKMINHRRNMMIPNKMKRIPVKKYNLKDTDNNESVNTDVNYEAPNENDEELDENTIQATSSEPNTMDTDVNSDVPDKMMKN